MIQGLGSNVTYTDTDGRTKAAIITATVKSLPDTDQKSGIPAPEPGHVHLHVFSFTGHQYAKYNVPLGEGPGTFSASLELEVALAG